MSGNWGVSSGILTIARHTCHYFGMFSVCQVPGLESRLCFQFSSLLMHTKGGSRWWLKHLRLFQTCKIWMEFWAPWAWSSPSCCGYLGMESVDEDLSLLLFLSHSASPINKKALCNSGLSCQLRSQYPISECLGLSSTSSDPASC